jgi:hypothetical protein
MCDIQISYSQLSGPATSAAIRWGREGANGPLAFTLASDTFASPFREFVGVPWSVLSWLDANQDADTLYVVVSTDAYPEGEVRAHFTNMTPPAVEVTSWGLIRALYR